MFSFSLRIYFNVCYFDPWSSVSRIFIVIVRELVQGFHFFLTFFMVVGVIIDSLLGW